MCRASSSKYKAATQESRVRNSYVRYTRATMFISLCILHVGIRSRPQLHPSPFPCFWCFPHFPTIVSLLYTAPRCRLCLLQSGPATVQRLPQLKMQRQSVPRCFFSTAKTGTGSCRLHRGRHAHAPQCQHSQTRRGCDQIIETLHHLWTALPKGTPDRILLSAYDEDPRI